MSMKEASENVFEALELAKALKARHGDRARVFICQSTLIIARLQRMSNVFKEGSEAEMKIKMLGSLVEQGRQALLTLDGLEKGKIDSATVNLAHIEETLVKINKAGTALFIAATNKKRTRACSDPSLPADMQDAASTATPGDELSKRRRVTCVFETGVRAMPVPADLLCPITGELMRDPVLLTGDGCVYERETLGEFLTHNTKISPSTQKPLASCSFIVPCKAIRDQIQNYVQENSAADVSISSGPEQ